MRTRQYKVGYNKDVVVVKGPIDHFEQMIYDEESGMKILAVLDDKLPMVEYGVCAWPVGEPVDEKHDIMSHNWKFFERKTDGKGHAWDYYISKPVETFTRAEVEDIFQKYFAPFLREDEDIGDKIMEALGEREHDVFNI